MRGYDPAEVRSFLETISQEMERLQEIIQLQEQDLERIKTELTAFQRMERNMKEALVNAQETLKEAREGSQREAVLRRREAEIEAVQIVKDAYKRREEVLREVEALCSKRDSFVRKLRALLRSELELMELLEGVDINPLESNPKRDAL